MEECNVSLKGLDVSTTRNEGSNDYNYIEITRSILQTIGFRNTFYEKKDSKGNIKLNEKGNPMLRDMRTDFCSAIRCLRKTVGFVEGASFDDTNANFVILKAVVPTSRHGGAGLNKQTVWIRKEMLDKWIDVAMFSGKYNNKSSKGIVYFIHQEGDFKRFKIGYTTDLSERLLSLQKGSPYLLVVYKTIENVTRKKETQLHRFFEKYHIRGEWFAINPDMIEAL